VGYVQGVHQTDTDRQFVCLITCSDKQTVLQLLLKQTRQTLFCLQTVCKHWLGIDLSRYLVQCLTQTLTLPDQPQILVICISRVCNLRGERTSLPPPPVAVTVAYVSQAAAR